VNKKNASAHLTNSKFKQLFSSTTGGIVNDLIEQLGKEAKKANFRPFGGSI
jgi:hypothetical protein